MERTPYAPTPQRLRPHPRNPSDRLGLRAEAPVLAAPPIARRSRTPTRRRPRIQGPPPPPPPSHHRPLHAMRIRPPRHPRPLPGMRPPNPDAMILTESPLILAAAPQF